MLLFILLTYKNLLSINRLHIVNKEHRNSNNPKDDIRHALIPDIKISYKKKDMEIIVVKHQKRMIIEDIKINKKDTTKISMMVHGKSIINHKFSCDNNNNKFKKKTFCLHLSCLKFKTFISLLNKLLF